MLSIMRESDLEAASHLFSEIFTGPPHGYEWLTAQEAHRYLGDLLRAPGALGFFYTLGDRPVALCLGSVSDYFLVAQYEIKEFGVSEAFQGKGIGTRMLAGMKDHLIGLGIEYVYLHTARSIPAYDFYIKNAFAVVKENVSMMKRIGSGEDI